MHLIIFFLIATIPVSAQQWVLDEIAEEHDSSESIPTWLVGVLLIIGFLVYKYLQRKDEEEQERRIKEQKYEEEQQLEEQLQKYREQHDDDIDFYEDDDNLIIPDIPSARIINKEPSATKSVSDANTYIPNATYFIKSHVGISSTATTKNGIKITLNIVK